MCGELVKRRSDALYCSVKFRNRHTAHIYRRHSPRRAMFNSAKRRAKAKGLPFTIVLNDIHIGDTCPVLGIPLLHGIGRACRTSPSLDRIKNELGYVPGNVMVISQQANHIKSDATIAELEAVLKYMKAHE